MRKLSVLVAFLTLLVVQGCNSSDQKASDEKTSGNGAVALKFNLQKGKTYLYSMKTEMESEVQGQKMQNDMAFQYSMEVLNDNDSLKTVRTIFDRIQLEMRAGPMEIDVDTNEPQKDTDVQKNPMAVMSNMFYAMKGKAFDMKINERGAIVSVTGIEDMMNAMMNSLPGDPNTKQATAQAFQSQFNEEAMKKMFEQSFNIFPDKSVKEGDTWTKTVDMGGIEMVTTYKVKDIDGNNVLLDASSEMNANNNKGTQTGTMKVNANTGLVTEAVLDNTFTSEAGTTKTKTTVTGKEK